MAGNPCEELSPTGGKKKKKKKKNRTRSYVVLRQFKDQVQPAHKSQVLLQSSSHTYHICERNRTHSEGVAHSPQILHCSS